MPSGLQFIGLDKPTLPYRSNSSPTDDSPHYIPGSLNALATISGWMQKRPGFSLAVESALTSVPGKIRRIYTWKRWEQSATNPGCFYVMVSTDIAVTGGAKQQVWAINLGNYRNPTASGYVPAQPSFTLLYDGGINQYPFDFINQSNFVFFGNASTQTNMRKWDGSGISTQWGLFAPPAAPDFAFVNGILPPGLSFDPATGTFSGTPTSPGSTSVTVTVTDSTGTTASQALNLQINAAGLQWKTRSLPPATNGAAYSQTLAVQSGTGPYVFSVFSGSLPAGITLSSGGVLSGTPTGTGNSAFALKVTDSLSATAYRSFTLFVNASGITLSPSMLPPATVGSYYNQTLTAGGGTSPYTYALVSGSTIPAGITLDPATGILSGTPAIAGSYSLILRATDSSATPKIAQFLYTLTINAVSLTITTTSIPDAQVGVPYSQAVSASGGSTPYSYSFTAGTLTAQTGYVYGCTYVSNTNHESAMSVLSENTGLFTDQDVEVSVIASPDPQVVGINIYRTADGGVVDPSFMRLVNTVPNATTTYIDSTPDKFLEDQTGPPLYLNAPPQPLRGLITSNGRIWGQTGATEWFTGNEEITNGTPVECMSNAKDGNFYPWPSEIGGITSTRNGVDAGLAEEFWQVSGDTLATFSKSRLLTGGGTLSPTNICTVGDTVYWIDSSLQVWSSANGEIGEPLRPDFATIDPQRAFICYHKKQNRNWLCVLNVAAARLYIYDMDLEMWQTPWTCTATAIASGQTSPTSIDLIASFPSGHVRILATGAYDDDGATYADALRCSLLSVIPGARTTARNLTEPRQPKQIDMEMDSPNRFPDTMLAIADSDPTISLTNPAWADVNDPITQQFGQQGALDPSASTTLVSRRWKLDQQPSAADIAGGAVVNGLRPCRRMAFHAGWMASAAGWKVYTLDIAHKDS